MQRSLFLLILMGQCSFFTCHLYEYHFVKEAMNWHDARRYCKDKYTDLATVSNKTDMMRLRADNQTEAWIGLHRTGDNRTWHWSLPGVEFNENDTNWGNTEPNDAGPVQAPYENCGFIFKNLKWGDISCEKPGPFLCYNESGKSNETFHLIREEKKWLDAQSYCRENHTDLVSGRDQLEDEELKDKLSKLNCEIGDEQCKIRIGLFRDKWRWSDGSNFSFRHWDQEPDKQRGQVNENCTAIMLDENTKWKNDTCDKKKPFFCYDDKVILIKENKTWEEALYYCRDNHRDLVSITNLHEQRWIQERAKKAGSPYVWLGLRYTCTLEFWFWVSDEPVRYKNWASGGQIDDCDMSGAMDREGRHQWFSHLDNEKFNFICSKS